MSFQGHIENGVVVFDEPVKLPEGTAVRVEPMNSIATGTGHSGTREWNAAIQAAEELRASGYDLDAVQGQRDYDLKHARDHQP